ncbi:MAG: hypothetical protein ABIQ39_05265 [Ilumatobacteraceae bacterium]
MTALAGSGRRRTMVMLAANIVAVSLIVVLLVYGRDALGQYTAAKRADSGLPIDSVPSTPTALFATVDSANQLTSLSIFVLAPSLRGGSIVSVPVNIDSTQAIGDQRTPFSAAYSAGGAPGLLVAVESTLGLTLDYSSVAGPAQSALMLGAVAPLDVDLPRTVVSDSSGSTQVVFNRGPRSMSAAEAVQVLDSRSSTVEESARTPNIEALWSAVSVSVGEGRPSDSVGPSVSSFADLTAHLFAGRVGTRGLALSPFPPDTPGLTGDLAMLDRSEEVLVFASIAPGAMSAPANGLSFRVIAPPGYEARVKFAIDVLLYAGHNVISVDLTATKQDKTEMYIYDQSVKATTDLLTPSFGNFSYGTPKSQMQGINATLVLGADFLDQNTPVASPETFASTTDAAVG